MFRHKSYLIKIKIKIEQNQTSFWSNKENKEMLLRNKIK
jgi:hypothetical protein